MTSLGAPRMLPGMRIEKSMPCPTSSGSCTSSNTPLAETFRVSALDSSWSEERTAWRERGKRTAHRTSFREAAEAERPFLGAYVIFEVSFMLLPELLLSKPKPL
jgi:hypothetical protein